MSSTTGRGDFRTSSPKFSSVTDRGWTFFLSPKIFDMIPILRLLISG
jgi:hypothetical protein